MWHNISRATGLMMVSLLCCGGCAIVDPDRADAIREAAQWKAKAQAASPQVPPELRPQAQQAYADAQAAVNGWISETQARIDLLTPNPFAQIKLSASDIPPDV